MGALKVYVAGASTSAEAVAGYIARLRDGGIAVTNDWTIDVLAARHAGVPESELDSIQRLNLASADFAGIARADIFWLLVPDSHSIGCWVELGYAHGIGTPIIASGPRVRRTIFTEYAQHFSTDDIAAEYLLRRAKEGV